MAGQRASLVLYSRKDDPRSHAVRIVLAEKALDVDIIDVNPARPPEDLLDLNPYHEVPTFADRELAVYDTRVLFEYLEERHPHPPLWPLEPTQRARLRLAVSRIERDWFGLEAVATQARLDGNAKAIANANRDLREAVLAATPLFRAQPFFLSNAFSFADAAVSALLWRLPLLGIELGDAGADVKRYAQRLFARPSFRASLTTSGRLVSTVAGDIDLD